MESQRTYIAIDLKSFYASVECVERKLNPLTTNLVVADTSRTEKTICLAVSTSLKACGIPGRPRLFEVVQKVRQVNGARLDRAIQSRSVRRDEIGSTGGGGSAAGRTDGFVHRLCGAGTAAAGRGGDAGKGAQNAGSPAPHQKAFREKCHPQRYQFTGECNGERTEPTDRRP